ncbi:MAG: hypothetical protein MUE60_11365, partial [Candidatus Eisenbacteria bacterium]|nr:hypothetical protein [Candidatus Eisenbacteria bacterium]
MPIANPPHRRSLSSFGSPVIVCLLAGLFGTPCGRAGAAAVDSAATLTYAIVLNGRTAPEEGTITVECTPTAARVRHTSPGKPTSKAPLETGYFDFATDRSLQVAEFQNNAACFVATPFSEL